MDALRAVEAALEEQAEAIAERDKCIRHLRRLVEQLTWRLNQVQTPVPSGTFSVCDLAAEMGLRLSRRRLDTAALAVRYAFQREHGQHPPSDSATARQYPSCFRVAASNALFAFVNIMDKRAA